MCVPAHKYFSLSNPQAVCPVFSPAPSPAASKGQLLRPALPSVLQSCSSGKGRPAHADLDNCRHGQLSLRRWPCHPQSPFERRNCLILSAGTQTEVGKGGAFGCFKIPSTWKEVDSLVYSVSSRKARATQGDPVLKQTNPTQNNINIFAAHVCIF